MVFIFCFTASNQGEHFLIYVAFHAFRFVMKLSNKMLTAAAYDIKSLLVMFNGQYIHERYFTKSLNA